MYKTQDGFQRIILIYQKLIDSPIPSSGQLEINYVPIDSFEAYSNRRT
ncbi:MAG: hypothetical protein F6K17_24020 [Okeania sp. SIO3C4]|nr:hypothetical protein [Okeania sp. SIO3B3]NER05439.1 hypothetical protein [Okeania sp. SIO3C4]